MKLPIAGSSYENRAIAAGAMESLNWYPENIEDAAGSGKGKALLRQTPGAHLLRNVTTHAGFVRGMWSGGGRLFVCVGAYVYELDNTGATVGSPSNLLFNDANPVQFAGNGQQLGLVANGFFYLNNGSGFVASKFKISGTVTIVGTAVTWTAGDQFPSTFGTVIIISGQAVGVAAWVSATALTLSVAWPGSGTGTVDTFYNIVFWASGDLFSDGMKGLPFTINGVAYTVQSVLSTQYLLLLDTDNAGQQTGATYSAVQSNLVYSAPAGDPVTAETLAYLDGQFYVQRPSGGSPDLGRQVNFSAVNDGTDWSGLDFFIKEGAPDYIQSILADREQLFVFGTESSEVWQNDPNTGRPVRMQGAVAKEGSAARFAVVSMQEHIYFIGGSPGGGASAYRVDGFTPTRISTHAVEEAWATNSEFASTAVAWWYLDDGHYFWVICFANASSWVYDATEKSWHERQSWNGAAFAPYRWWFHTFIPEWSFVDGDLNGAHIVGDYNSGKVCVLSSRYFDEESIDMKRIRVLPYIYAGGNKRTYVNRLDLEAATGLVPSGPAPTVTLEWSLDNGATFSTPDSASLGAHGETNTRIFWIAQGSAESSMLPRITMTGKAETVLIDCEAEVFLGDS